MGTLYYGNMADAIHIPDHLLAHVKVVVATKLRRSESFTLSWRHPAGDDPGRTTLWLQPAIPLRFVFDTAEAEALDPELLKKLALGANSAHGLVIDIEDSEPDARMSLVTSAA